MESNNFLRDATVKNFCPLCGKLFYSNDALFNHMSREHSSYDCKNAMPHNPIIIQASQQQLTDHTINSVYRKPKKNIPNLNRIAAIQNQDKMAAVFQHNRNNESNPNMSHNPNPFMNYGISNDPRYAHFQTPAPTHLNHSNTAFNNSKMHIRNDNQNRQTKAQSNVVGTTQFLPSSGYQQEMTPILRTNSRRPCDTAQHSPAKTNPVMNNSTITSKDNSELYQILSCDLCEAHRSSDVGAQNTNSAGHASQPQPEPKDIEVVSKKRYMVNYCTLCREEFDNQVDVIKHIKQHENNTEINRQTEVSQRCDATVQRSIKPTQRRNTALELPQAPPKIIAIENDGPEQQKQLHIDLLHSTTQHRVDNHTLQSQQSLLEHAKAKNASIRAPKAGNSLNFSVNTDTELSLRTNQHNNVNKKDENISNINNNAKGNTNNSECEAFVKRRKRSYSRLDAIASNEDDGRDSRKNKKYNLDVENRNLHEGLHTKSSQFLSSSEYYVNASNNNQNNNTINANENEQKSSNNENHSSSEDDTKDESSRADDTSDDDDNIKKKNSIRDQESKTKKPPHSDHTRGENPQFDSSDFPVTHSILSKIVENCVKELLRPTYNNTKEKSNSDNKSSVGVKKYSDSSNSTDSNNKPYDPIPSALKGRQVKHTNKHKNPKSLKDNFKTHSSVVKNKKNYKLDENPNTNSSQSTHFIVYKCAECETCFHSMITIDRHKKKRECCEKCLETVKCDLCPLKFFANSLKKHKTEHHSETASNSVDLVIMGKHNVRTETLTLAKRTNNERANKVQKINTDSKPILKLKNKQIATSFAECYKSYSKTIYKCGICDICFATESTIGTHIQENKHAMTIVKKCSTCKLTFSSITLERHRYFHHEYLKLKNKSDFTIIIRPKLRIKTNNPKKKPNSKKVFFSTVNNKKRTLRPIDPKGKTSSSSLQNDKKISKKTIKHARDSDQQQIRDRPEERIQEVPKDVSNQNSLNTEENLKGVNTLYKCSPCDVYFMKNTDFLEHLVAKHKLAKEPYLCTFCRKRFIVSIEYFKLHVELHFKSKEINNLIIEDSMVTVDATRPSYDNLTNDPNNRLKECVVKPTTLKSTLLTTTPINSNSKHEVDLKQPLNSQKCSDHSSPNLTTKKYEGNIAKFEYENRQLSDKSDKKNYLIDDGDGHENEPQMPSSNFQSGNIQQLENYTFVKSTVVSGNHDTEDSPLLENKIQETLNVEKDHVEDKARKRVFVSNCNEKSIKILSYVVLKEPTRKDDQLRKAHNVTQLRNLQDHNTIDKKGPSTDTNLMYHKKDQTPIILGDSNVLKDDDDNVPELHENKKLNSEKHNSISENFTPKSSENSSTSLTFLATNHRESYSEPKQCFENKLTISYGSDAVSDTFEENDPQIAEVTRIGPKLNKDKSKSTEDLIKLLEDDSKQDTTMPDEEQKNIKFESTLNITTDVDVTKYKVTFTENDNVFIDKNQSEIGNLIETSNTDVPSYISTDSSETSESNEMCNINKKLTNISENEPEILIIDDDASIENEVNELDSHFIDDLYEVNTENNSNNVNQQHFDRKLISIKLPKVKFTTVTPHLHPDLS